MDVAKILEMPLRMKNKQNMVFKNFFFLTVLIAGTKKPLEMIAPVNNKSEKDNISQNRMPKLQTSDFSVKISFSKYSKAIHLNGTRALDSFW